tara:strand:+ start:335 stop:883 length:549 start_codon:yes stop_codon:yes gene_type:complete
MSQLQVNSIVPVGGLPVGASGGGIIQCVSTFKNDTFSTTSTSLTDITGFNVTITPTSSASKILLISEVGWGNDTNSAATFMNQLVRVVGGSPTNIANPDTSTTSGGTAPHSNPNTNVYYSHNRWSYTFLDSPATTSAITYKWQVKAFSGATTHINRRHYDSTGNVGNDMQGTSTITALEISG